MIRSLAFDRDGRMTWVVRSPVPLSGICAAGNAVRETLRELLGRPIDVDVSPPLVPDPAAWPALAGEALVAGIAGSAAEVALLLRPSDAATLCAAAFGECGAAARALSRFEAAVLERLFDRLSGAFAHLCGVDGARRSGAPRVYGSYFEVTVRDPAARIGVAFIREPALPAAATLRLEQLAEVPVECTVECARGTIALAAAAALRPGDLVPMTTTVGSAGVLRLGSGVLAAVECGERGTRRACLVK